MKFIINDPDNNIIFKSDLTNKFPENSKMLDISKKISINEFVKCWYLPCLSITDSNNNKSTWITGFNGTTAISYYRKKIKVTKYNHHIYNVEKAYQYCKNVYLNKIRNGYHKFGENRKNTNTQLGVSFKIKEIDNKENIINANLRPEWFPCAVVVKLDGIRGIYNVNKGKIISRTGKDLHFLENFENHCKILLSFINNYYNLDGELYAHGLNLYTISSIIRQKLNKSKNIKKIRYYIFDIMIEETVFEDRMKILKTVFDKYNIYCNKNEIRKLLKLVDYNVVNSYENITKALKFYVDEGYEGIVIRQLSEKCPIKWRYYNHGRTNALIKYKLFRDEQCIIIGIVSGKGKNIDKPTFVVRRIKKGFENIIFRSQINATDNDQINILTNKEKYIGCLCNVKYSNVTENNVLWCPKITDIIL